MQRTRTERWLFGRRRAVALLAAAGLAYGILAAAGVLASDFHPSHFVIIDVLGAIFFLAIPGGAAAFGTLWLMAVYLARYDPQPYASRRPWLPWFIVGGTFTASVYCFAVYCRQPAIQKQAPLQRRPWRTP